MQMQVARVIWSGILSVIQLPGLVPLLLFYILFRGADGLFSVLFFEDNGVFTPAFPHSWRFLLLLLAVVPVFALVQLLWLASSGILIPIFRNRWRKRQSGPRAHGYIMLQLDSSENPTRHPDDLEERGVPQSRSASPTAHASIPRRLVRGWWIQSIAYSFLLCVSLWADLNYEHPGDIRYRAAIESAVAHPRRLGHAKNEKVFIAAMFSNNEDVIPYWSASLVKVIHYLGPANVFVSILESYSSDQSPMLLRKLDAKLGHMDVARRILTQDNATERPEDMNWNHRINFLSAIRNRALQPLVERGGYDKVVFSNDIYIEPESWIDLLETADGEYDMACGLDFGHFGGYDAWVLRDRQRRLTSTMYVQRISKRIPLTKILARSSWPYFFDPADYRAMQDEAPVPVFTCWNGIVVLSADPLLPIHLRSNRTLSTEPFPFELPSTHPAAANACMRGPSPALTPPVRFRASAPGECYSSESFLLPYDLRRLFNLQRIFVNPRVVTAYQWRFYVYFKWLVRHWVLKWWIERVYDGAWMRKAVMVVGDPEKVFWWDGGDCHPW